MTKDVLYQRMNEDRRNSILRAAQHYFVQHGINNTANMSDIAKQAGVSRQTLYQHFKNLDDVIYAIAENVMEQVAADLTARKQPGLAPLDAIQQTIRILFNRYNEQPESSIFLVLFDVYNRASTPERGHPREYQEFLVQFPRIFDDIEAGIADGSIRQDLDPALAHLTLTNAVVGAWQRLILVGSKGDPADTLENEKLIDEIVEMAVRYLRK